jgi:hypothetical protein
MNNLNGDNKKEWVSPTIIEEDFNKTELGFGEGQDGESQERGDVIS